MVAHLNFFLYATNFTSLEGEPERESDLSLVLVETPGPVDEVLPNAEQLLAANVDWNTLEINEMYDEYEGRLEIIEDDHVFQLLGLRDEE